MGKGNTILGLVGLILAAGGLGFGFFTWSSFSRIESQVGSFSAETTWYKYNVTYINCIPASTVTFTGLTIDFELGSNESVYFSFEAQAHLEPAVQWSSITIYFKLDGIYFTDTHAKVGLFNGGTANLQIVLQHTFNDLTSGEHNVTVAILGTSSGNYIHFSSLFVQKIFK